MPAPKGEVCIWDSLLSQGHCYDGASEKSYDLSSDQVHKYIMRSSQYDQKLAEWCIEGWRRAGEKNNGY